jgi:hypothetical protein
MPRTSKFFRDLVSDLKEWADGNPLIAVPTTLGNQALVEAWTVLDALADQLETQRKTMREVLLARAKEHGKPTEKGGNRWTIGESEVLRECRRASLPDEETVRTLLTARGMPFDAAFSAVTKVVLDASKVEALVSLGKLPAAKIEAARKVTWALRVKPAEPMITILESVTGMKSEETTKAKAAKKTKKE